MGEKPKGEKKKKKTLEDCIVNGKSPKNFSINRPMLNCLPYYTLRQVFYGMNNFHSPALYKSMNPTEILGLFAGIADKTFISRKKTLEDEFPDRISTLVSKGYKDSGRFRKYKEKALYDIANILEKKEANLYSIKPNSLKQRIEELDDKVKQESLKQLLMPKKFSNAERPDGMDFYDPNIDGKSKTVYISNIMKKLKSAYDEVTV